MAAGVSWAALCPAPRSVPHIRQGVVPRLSAARCSVHAAALLVLAVRCNSQTLMDGTADLLDNFAKDHPSSTSSSEVVDPADILYTVRCSTNCNGQNLCIGVCGGQQDQVGKCPVMAECAGPAADVCADGPIPCQFSEWADWAEDTKCSGLCIRKRSIAIANRCGGIPCEGPLVDTKRCHALCNPPRDCEYSPWSSWVGCGANTTNQRERTRSIITMPRSTGMACNGETVQTQACGTALQGGVDCKVTTWMDWAPCDAECGGGQKIRFRTIMTEGKACPGAVSQTDGCNFDPCLVGSGSPVDCVLGPWTGWTACDSNNQKIRRRVVQSRLQNGGRACQGALDETQSCGARDTSTQDCLLEDWGPWNLCSLSCGGGQTYRQRAVKAEPRNGGRPCTGALRETKECSTQGCGIGGANSACTLSTWSMWSLCTVSCGVGSQSRERTIVAEAHHLGQGCSASLGQVRGCENSLPCDLSDCLLSNWGAWTQCSKTCGGGQTSRSRTIINDAGPAGKPCAAGPMTEFESCSTQPCPTACVDSIWGDWGGWTYCTKTCKGGYHSRSRSIAVAASACGKPATGPNEEFKSCNDMIDCNMLSDVDCQLSGWEDWGPCSSTCLGVRSRSRHVSIHGSGHGAYCGSRGEALSLKAVEMCGMPHGFGQAYQTNEISHFVSVCGLTPPKDCEMSEWSLWSVCSTTCTGGQRSRHRTIEQFPAGAGKGCEESLGETEPCNSDRSCGLGGVSTNCSLGDWSHWGLCEGCSGQRYRARPVKAEPAGGGSACAAFSSTETGGCHPHSSECASEEDRHSPFFCVWTTWTHWSDCSRTCGNGNRQRSQIMAGTDMEPLDYAAVAKTAEECFGEREELGLCHPGDCPPCEPQDCVLGDWSHWSSPTCEGLCTQNRSVIVEPNECGAPCIGSLRGAKECYVDRTFCGQPRDCQFSDWGSYSYCSSTSGQMQRERAILVHPTLTGEECAGALKDTAPCVTKSNGDVPLDCLLHEWGTWSTCDKTCGGGQMVRSRKLDSEAFNGGKPCTARLSETEACAEQACPGDTAGSDCQFGPWSVWSICNKTRGDLQVYRERHILHGATENGKACNGDTQETTECPGLGIQDCLFSDWTSWTGCSSTCSGGNSKRARSVHTYASPGGVLCNGDLIQMEPCNSGTPCGPPKDCELVAWSTWSVCVPSGVSGDSCGDGHKVRTRRVADPGDPGGKPCETTLEEVAPCRQVVCPGSQDCKWQDWESWQPCVKAEGPCGIGYKRRTRSFAQLPSGGGTLCEPKTKDQLTPVMKCQGQLECCIDGKWSEWNQWSSCSATCGGGTRKRKRIMTRNATWCGRTPDGSDTEFDFCKMPNCSKQDCELSDWGPWTPDIQVKCSEKCSEGHVERTRMIKTPASRSGRPCHGALHEWKRCPYDPSCGGTHPPARDCVLGPWSMWSACSRSCDQGYRTKKRAVSVYPAYGGANCSSDTLLDVQGCNADIDCHPYANKVNCVWTQWTTWSACIDGERKSTRGVLTPEANGGNPCTGPQKKFTGCGQCVKDTYQCVWGQWGSWSACSQTCGTGGKRTRSRYLHLGGQPVMGATQSAFSLPRLEAPTGKAGLTRVQELALAFGAGAGVLVLLIVLRPLMQRMRSRTLWLGREYSQAPSESSEATSASADARTSGTYAALQLQQVEEGPAE